MAIKAHHGNARLRPIRSREIIRDMESVRRFLLKRSGQNTAASKAATMATVAIAQAAAEFQQRNLLKSAVMLDASIAPLRQVNAWTDQQIKIHKIIRLLFC